MWLDNNKRMKIMKYLNYIVSSLVLLFVPIYGILIAVATAIILDTFTGIFKSIKLNGWNSFKSRRLSHIISKMLLYEICILLLFVIDKFILNEFIFKWLSIDFMFTKICAILLIFIELVSIKENIEAAFKIDIWKILKKLFLRAKEVKSNINDII
jgi:hypothetical protein